MSKALQPSSNKQIFSILEAQLKRQDEQGQTIHTMFDSVKMMYGEFTQGMADMKVMVQEVRDSVTLTNSECDLMQSAVASKSINLTKDRFAEEEDSFPKVVGKHRRMIWSQLKKKYGVPKYNCVRRIDFQGAMDFISNFRVEDFM
jgi:hypothetical protein